MRFPALLLVAGLVGWAAQTRTVAPASTAAAAESSFAQGGETPSHLAKDKATNAIAGQNDESAATPARNKPAKESAQDICRTVEQAAAENQLPVNFFARVIWQESRFDARAVSAKGAQGIAQFTPKTAVFRGLANPFDPVSSLKNAARYLGDLRKRFGNLGLAAAGYNAGPGRVREWLDGKGALPRETRDYVAITTGRTAEEWASPSPPRAAEATIPQNFPCTSIARLVLAPLMQGEHIAACVLPPWSVQPTANWSKGHAKADYHPPREPLATLIGGRGPIVLRKRFGYLGPAGACSNADPGRLREWRAAKGALMPIGRTANEWTWPSPAKPVATSVSQGVSSASTTALVLSATMKAQRTIGQVPRWGAQLTANLSETVAWATYRTMQKRFAALIGGREPIMLHGRFPGLGAAPRFMVRIADDSRANLEGFCSKLIAAGGACAVLRNEEDQGKRPLGSQLR